MIYERRVLNVSFHSLSPPLFSNNSQESSNRSIFRNRWHEILKFLFRFILSSTSLNLSRDFISRRSPIKPPIPISTNLSFSLSLSNSLRNLRKIDNTVHSRGRDINKERVPRESRLSRAVLEGSSRGSRRMVVQQRIPRIRTRMYADPRNWRSQQGSLQGRFSHARWPFLFWFFSHDGTDASDEQDKVLRKTKVGRKGRERDGIEGWWRRLVERWNAR